MEVSGVEANEGHEARTNPRSSDRLSALYRAEGSAAVRLAYVLTGDRYAAEDIAHEAFVRVGRKIFRLRDPQHERAYLLRTVINITRGRARRRRSESAALQKVSPLSAAHAGPDHSDQDEMWQALLHLPVRQRAALFLRYYQDLSEIEAASTLECSVSAIKSLVNRGLRDLRRRFEGAEG